MDRLEEHEQHEQHEYHEQHEQPGACGSGPLREYEARLRGHQLADLRWHWGEAYKVTWANGMFRAVRRDNGAAVSAGTFAEIRQLIRDDYSAKPVPRDVTDHSP